MNEIAEGVICIDNLQDSAVYDKDGYHHDFKIEKNEVSEGVYEINITDMGRSDKKETKTK